MARDKLEFRKYVLVFSATVSLILAALLAAAFYIQPLDGELTRLGSYAERDFGWNLSQKKIRADARLIKTYQEYSDVLIIGDSFSTSGIWQLYFQQKTGFSYETLDLRTTSLTDLLKSKPFRDYPPKIVLLQSVEREIIYFFKDLNFECSDKKGHEVYVPIKGVAEMPEGEYLEEKRKTFDLRNINLKYAASVIVNTVIRGISSADSKFTKKYRLTNDALFSNNRSGEMLIYDGDMQKLAWRKEDIAKAVCSIRGLQDKIQSNGKTLFIFMLAPDKSTAYAEFIESPVFMSTIQTVEVLEDYGVNAPRIDLILKAAIRRGEKDVYLPSGTHWSSRGYVLAAEGLSEFLKNRSMPSP